MASAVLTVLLWRDLRADRAGRARPGWHWLLGLAVVLAQAAWITGEILLLWQVVRELDAATRGFFHAFWWGLGAVTLLNLALILTPDVRRVLAGFPPVPEPSRHPSAR